MVSAFEGNKAETKTMLPVIEVFMTAHRLPDVTVVADAGMVFGANQKEIESAGLSFILGAKIPHVPYVLAQWRREHPGEQIPDGHIFTQPWPATQASGRRDKTIYYQYRHDRGRRTLRGIDEQVKKGSATCVRTVRTVWGSGFSEQSTGYLNTYLNNEALPEHRRPSGHVLCSRSGAREPWPVVAGSAQSAGPGGLRSGLPGRAARLSWRAGFR